MNRLENEWKRLFAPGPEVPAGTPCHDLVGPAGQVRALVVELGRPADWRPLARLWESVQTDLGWPAPAIAVNGRDAFQLWMPLSAPVSAIEARAVLECLRQRYLSDVKPQRIVLWPAVDGDTVRHTEPVPQEIVAGQAWSAFVAPDLAAVFGDEPALDLPPGADAQADLLARIDLLAVQLARRLLAEPVVQPGDGGSVPAHAETVLPDRSVPGITDPRAFLLSVMNDDSVVMALRIEAAKALLGTPR